jgi:acetyl-CoA C-acetyltransferase
VRTSVEPRTPVIVGASQVLNQPADLADVVDAIGLMEQALVGAARDAGSARLLPAIDRLAVVQGRWRWPDPARLVADRVGAASARTVFAMACGSTPQDLVSDAGRRVLAGEADVVAICGGEWTDGRRRLRQAGHPLPVTQQLDGVPDEHFGRNRVWESPEESSRGFSEPLFIYAMFESAIAAARGESWDETRTRVAAISQRLNDAAASLAMGWRRDRVTMDELLVPSDENRMVVYPYTKWMVANPNVDLAFGLIMCAAEVADRLAIAHDRWIFPVAAASCVDHCWFTELGRFDQSPHHRLTACAALAASGLSIDDVEHLDLYSCFPSVIQLEADALGIDPRSRDITVTGGMPFFGGPLASYMGHAIVRTVELLREGPDSNALCVGNGGYMNKLASGIYSGSPGAAPFRVEDVSTAASATPHRRSSFAAVDRATVEASTVVFDRAGPQLALVSTIAETGERIVGSSHDQDVMATLLSDSWVGRDAAVTATGIVSLIE